MASTATASTSPAAPFLLVTARGLSVTAAARGNRPNIQKPRHAPWSRLKLLELSRPRWTDPHPTTEHQYRDCPREEELERKAELQRPNAFDMIYVAELKQWLEKSQMIGFFHNNIVRTIPKRTVRRHGGRFGTPLTLCVSRRGKTPGG